MRGGWEREEHGGIWGVLSPVPWGRGRRGFAGSARLWDAMPPRAFAPGAVPGKTWDPAALGVVGALYVWCPSWHWALALGRGRQPLGTCFLIACSLPTRPHLAQADSSIICLCHPLSRGQVSSAGLFLSLSLSSPLSPAQSPLAWSLWQYFSCLSLCLLPKSGWVSVLAALGSNLGSGVLGWDPGEA